MAGNCVCNFLSGVLAFVVGSLRVVLFIACILLFLSQFVNIWAVGIVDEYLELFTKSESLQVGFMTYGIAVGLAVVALIGAHGAYSRNPKYLKAFALIMSIWSVVVFLVLITAVMNTNWDHEAEQFTKRMQENAKDYQFDLKPTDEPNKATKAWDFLQRGFRCCGMKDYHDWEQWTSFMLLRSKRLPSSCCVGMPRGLDNTCSADSPMLFRNGCSEKVAMMLQASILSSFMQSIWYLVLAAIAIVVAKKHDPDHGSTSANQVVSSNQYERFQGSVYVRQPAMNEAYMANKDGPMYPDVSSAEKGPTPPPSYVSRA